MKTEWEVEGERQGNYGGEKKTSIEQPTPHPGGESAVWWGWGLGAALGRVLCQSCWVGTNFWFQISYCLQRIYLGIGLLLFCVSIRLMWVFFGRFRKWSFCSPLRASSVLQLCLFWKVCLQFLCYDLNLKQLRMVQKFSSVSLHTVGGEGESKFG